MQCSTPFPIPLHHIKFAEITDDGHVRHLVFQGLRLDKAPVEVEFEKSKNGKVK
jgi:ATP-dependent DNA ligase